MTDNIHDGRVEGRAGVTTGAVFRRPAALALAVIMVSMLAACSSGGDTLTVYSGRSEELVGPLFDQFEQATGIDVEVRYAGSAELAATLTEEGASTPADVFFAQDPASLGVVALEGLFLALPAEILDEVPGALSDRDGRWVGTSGRVRTVVFDSDVVTPDSLPSTVAGFTDETWKGRLGVAPTNGSFLAFVAAMILLDGEDNTRQWLEGLAANDPRTYSSNSSIVAAVADGEIDAGLVNHYYLLRRISEGDEGSATNYFFPTANAGGLVMPAGVGVIDGGDEEAALELVRFLLSPTAQEFFAAETFEYPLVPGVAADPALPDLGSLNPPELDLSQLAAVLDRATDLVAAAGLI